MRRFDWDKPILGRLTAADFVEAAIALVTVTMTFTLLFLFKGE